jgi:hypothetical protein
MSAPLILGVGVVYLAVALDQYRQGSTGMGVAGGRDAIANIGLAMAAK